MRGSIKLALISLKYKEKYYKRNHANRKIEMYNPVITKKMEVLIVINEEKRTVKFKEKVIAKICKELNIDQNKVIELNINSVDILKDLGRTVYDID